MKRENVAPTIFHFWISHYLQAVMAVAVCFIILSNATQHFLLSLQEKNWLSVLHHYSWYYCQTLFISIIHKSKRRENMAKTLLLISSSEWAMHINLLNRLKETMCHLPMVFKSHNMFYAELGKGRLQLAMMSRSPNSGIFTAFTHFGIYIILQYKVISR